MRLKRTSGGRRGAAQAVWLHVQGLLGVCGVPVPVRRSPLLVVRTGGCLTLSRSCRMAQAKDGSAQRALWCLALITLAVQVLAFKEQDFKVVLSSLLCISAAPRSGPPA